MREGNGGGGEGGIFEREGAFVGVVVGGIAEGCEEGEDFSTRGDVDIDLCLAHNLVLCLFGIYLCYNWHVFVFIGTLLEAGSLNKISLSLFQKLNLFNQSGQLN